MDRKELLRKLTHTFKSELDEHVATLNDGLLKIEKGVSADENDALLKELFRAAHSIKGSARAVEIRDIEIVSHKMEDVFNMLKKGALQPAPELVDHLLCATDMLGEAMDMHLQGAELPHASRNRVIQCLDEALARKGAALKPKQSLTDTNGNENEKTDDPQSVEDDVERSDEIDGAKSGKREESKTPAADAVKSSGAEAIRVSTDKLDALMAGMGQLLASRMRMEQRLGEMKAIQAGFSAWEKSWRKIRPCKKAINRQGGSPEMDALMDFFELNAHHLNDIGRKIDRLSERLEDDYRDLALLTGDMQDDVRRIRMVPMATLFDLFPRMVRDMAKEMEKEIQLRLAGVNTEIDRQVLAGLKDPLIHLLRNAIDHGIEPPDKREAMGKPRQGTISLKAFQQGNQIVLEVSDDGSGINLAAVRRAAMRENLITVADADVLETSETIDFIFQSGLSTHPVVTEISGRGVGMDVVREQLQKLHGQVKTTTEANRGTTFNLILPLTMATSHVLMLDVSGQTLAVPTTSVERILQIDPATIGSMEGQSAVNINGQVFPLISMARILGLPIVEDETSGADKLSVLLLGAVEKRMAFQVNGFIGDQEIVMKNLGRQLRCVKNIAGAAILGTGQVVMILNAGSLMQAARGAGAGTRVMAPQMEKIAAKKVLIVDDSITTRVLEKNILENQGYQVVLAADGLDGWERIQSEPFDAFVFDIEMPRMDGFQLAEKVRQDSRFEHLPIVLVTSLEASRDKIRGMEAGADAYITKGSFDQKELLDTIERLIG